MESPLLYMDLRPSYPDATTWKTGTEVKNNNNIPQFHLERDRNEKSCTFFFNN